MKSGLKECEFSPYVRKDTNFEELVSPEIEKAAVGFYRWMLRIIDAGIKN
jgi:hypothetical protein